MSPPIFAHLGHWYVSLPVFMGPALVLVLALKIQSWRERAQAADASGKRSNLTVLQADARTTLIVTGPLDYPALLEIEVELGRQDPSSRELVLDLRGVTRTDQDSAWHLCDVVGRTQSSGRSTAAIVDRGAAMRPLLDAFAAEGVNTTLVQGPHAVSS